MAGAHVFQAVQYPELDTLGLEAIRDFLKKRARYLRLVDQNNKADGVNVTPITVVTSIDPELLKNLIDMDEIDAESIDDCTKESVMKFLESTQERDASETAEFVKAQGMDMSELKKDFVEFVSYLKKMAIIHDEDCHVLEHKKTDDYGMKHTGKSSDAGSRSSGHNAGGISHEGAGNKASDRDRKNSGHGRSSDSTSTGEHF
jgi:hypothetical protein